MSHWPQILFLFMAALAFAFSCLNAGKPRGTYNPIVQLIAASIEIWVLYEGGFFAVWGWAP